MEFIILLTPVVVLVTAMYLTRRLGWQSTWTQLGAAGIASAALGSFIGAAAAAMASAYRPETAMLRGAGFGFLYGVGIGIIYIAIVALRRRLARRVD
ncbi:MAG: hypothetical protein ACRENG_30005 [bacterium]